MKLIWS